jgi:hypothetical protein
MTEWKGSEEGEEGVSEVGERVEEGGRETKGERGGAECTDVMGTALALWKTSRSKIGMWVALSVFREKLVKGRERGCGSVESVTSQYQFKECSELLLSAYFSRTKGTFRTKNIPQNIPQNVPQKEANEKSHNNSNSNSNSNNGRACVVVITSWDDIKDFLLPILPLTEQLLFTATAVSSLSLSPSTSLSTSDSSIGLGSAVMRGGDVSLDGEEPLPQSPLFQPVKWARHASGLMLLIKNGLSFSPPQQTTQSAPHSATHSAAHSTTQEILGPIVKALGYGSCDCWTALSCLAASATATCTGGQMTGGQKTGGAGIGTDKLFLVLQRIEYFLFSFLELNEQWRIDSSLNNIP